MLGNHLKLNGGMNWEINKSNALFMIQLIDTTNIQKLVRQSFVYLILKDISSYSQLYPHEMEFWWNFEVSALTTF
jgi:hypothetical protein